MSRIKILLNHMLSANNVPWLLHQRGRLLIAVTFIVGLAVLAALPATAVVSSEDTSAVTGTIAYAREGREIRLIEPDGSNDRRLWQSPNVGVYGVFDLAWKPNATEVTFSSDHEGSCSIFEVDLYAIRPDSSNLRRITNAPTCAALSSFPKGKVTVTVQNYLFSGGPFFVYVQGAPTVLPVTVPAGGSTTVTFNDVADFGDTLQQAVVIEGLQRWIAPIAAADVQPGQTVHAGTVAVAGAGLQNFGAHRPAWRSDNSELGFIFGGCTGMSHIEPNPSPGDQGTFMQNVYDFGCVMDWRPTPTGSNQILYWSHSNEGIYQTTPGKADLGTKLVSTNMAGWVWQVLWLPDASGFLYSYAPSVLGSANIYHYSFATGNSTPLTNFSDAFTRNFSISPDGQQIVFELAPTWDSVTSDLWLMAKDGSNTRLFVENAHAPAWSRRAPQLPQYIYLPFLNN